MRCGKMTIHAEGDTWPMCELCTQIRAAAKMLNDIADGRLEVPPLYNEQGEPIE